MNYYKTTFSGLLISLLLSTNALAQGASPSTTLDITFVDPKNKSLVELPNGNRQRVEVGMSLPTGARILAAGQGVIKGEYPEENCAVELYPNTIYKVLRTGICNPASVEKGQSVVRKTIKKITLPQTSSGVNAANTFGVNPLLIAGGAAVAVGAVALAADDDDDSSSDQPVSP